MLQEFLEKQNINPQKIAVGVSGGADSLATVLIAHEELSSLGYQIIALTVDHKLRKTSSDEAAYVADLMNKNGIEHHTLVWKGKKPHTGIEEAARIARYNLIEDWCQKNKISYLITAHHLYDQAETFLMRLERGSGLDGLCGMKQCSTLRSLVILRPFLKISPLYFKSYLTKRKIKWIEDESNKDKNLLRVRMRRFLPIMEEKTGITPLKIANTMDRLQSSRLYFENKVQSLIKNNFRSFNKQAFCCPLSFFIHLEGELQYRLSAYLLKTIANVPYSPEADKILKLLNKIQQENFKSATLCHCQILSQHGFLWFMPEKIENPFFTNKIWKDFVCKNKNYKNIKLPAALKRLLTLSKI